METVTTSAGRPWSRQPGQDPATRRPQRIVPHLVTAALVLLAVKPLLDIGEGGGDGLDVGVLLTALGAGLMIGALLLFVISARVLPPRPLLLMGAGLAALLILSALNYLAVPARSDLLELFDIRRHAIYGLGQDPATGIPAEAMRLVVGFAPLALVALLVLRRDWFPVRRLGLIAGVVVFGAVVHSVLAWLQVVGVMPYSFFFELADYQKIGRASGGYFHPMSLGRLLMFAVFLVYVLGQRMRVPVAVRYALIGLFVATGVVSLHRFTILCLGLIVAAFELQRLRSLLTTRRRGQRIDRRAVAGVGGATVAAAALVAVLWGEAVWHRAEVVLTEVGSLDVRSDTFMHGRGAIWNDTVGIFGRAGWDVWLAGFGYEPWDMHNDVLRLLVVWGGIGVLVTVALLVGLYRFVGSRIQRPHRLALAVLFGALVVFGLTQKPLAYPYFLWLFIFGQMVLLAAADDPADRHEETASATSGVVAQ